MCAYPAAHHPTVAPQEAAPFSTNLPPRLLRSNASGLAALDFDQHQRYHIVARILDRLLAGVRGQVQILEVGSNVLNLLARFLDPDRVHIVRCDVEPVGEGSDFVLLQRDEPLPFPPESFDAVVALEVLEHLPREDRRAFMADCLRVARQGAVWTCPNGIPAVVGAERLAAECYRARQGQAHPFLTEHQDFGIPSPEEVTTILRDLEYPFTVMDNAPLERWLGALVLSETLTERQASTDLREPLNHETRAAAVDGQAVPYRKVYVCAKTLDATRALDLDPMEDVPPAEEPAVCFPRDPFVEALNQTAAAAVDALSVQADDRRREVADLQHRLEASQAHVEDLQAQHGVLHADLAGRKAELGQLRHQREVLRFLLESRAASRFGRWGQRLRSLYRIVRPLRFRGLIPWHEVEPEPGAPPGSWRSVGPDPQFLLPCLLAAGWIRIRLRLTTTVPGRLEIYADSGDGFVPTACVDRLDVANRVERDFYVHLSRPVQALRLDPVDTEGSFRIDQFEAESLPMPAALLYAFIAKLRLLMAYRQTWPALRNGLGMLLRGRFDLFWNKLTQGLPGPTSLALVPYGANEAYAAWRARHRLTDADRARMQVESAGMANPPRISVLMPVFDPPERYLRLAIESVLHQTYAHWELCIADDGSTAVHARPVLEEYAQRDPRIRVVFRETRGNIAAASNSALELASGEYVALLDQDDELAEHALFRVAQTIAADPRLDMIYSDEDKLEPDGRHVDPFFKPDWSPEYFQACMYTCHLGVYRTTLVREVGGFRSEFDTAQDYDLALRIVARSARVGHIPDVLYHWRKLPTSTAVSGAAKPQAHATARRALASYLEACGRSGTVVPASVHGFHRVRFTLAGRPRVSIIIPTGCRCTRLRGRDTTFLSACVESIRRTSTYTNVEVLAVDNDDMPPELQRNMETWGVRCIPFADEFNLAAKMNLGAAHATGEHLVFLNDDIEVISPDWLECLLEFSQQPEIGAVGAKLLFPDGRLQHGGVTILDGNPGHPFYAYPGDHLGYFCGNVVTRNYSAVTGACMMTRTDVFRAAGGFDSAFPLNYNDVDYCLRVRAGGKRIVYTPHACLYHHESATKAGIFPPELAAFKERWADRIPADPYYSPHLTTRYHDYRIKTAEEEQPPSTANGTRAGRGER